MEPERQKLPTAIGAKFDAMPSPTRKHEVQDV
jgi:hypothetical protein